MDKKQPHEQLAELIEDIAQLKGMEAYARAKGNFKWGNRQHKNKFLYFIRCADAVKIGVSSCPWQRRDELQTGAPGELVLMSQIAKAGHRENECHKRLSHLRLHGEWFLLTQEVYDLIKELKDEMGQ